MPSSKKARSKKFPIVTLVGIILLLFLGFLFYKVMSPSPAQAPTETPMPMASVATINGLYKGNLPCADCPGITETLILAKDGTYILEDVYQEKSTKPYQTSGKWEIINTNILQLNPSDSSNSSYFQINNNSLQMLDSDMKKIDSPYNQTLEKQY